MKNGLSGGSERDRAKQELEIKKLGGKAIPQNIEIEEAVLGAMLLGTSELLSVIDILPSSAVFYREENQQVYDSILGLHQSGRGIDVLTVAQELKRSGNYRQIGGAKYLATLASKISSAAHAEIHARILLECWMKRSIIQSGTTLLAGCYDDSTDVFDLLESAEKLLSDSTGQIFKSVEESFSQIAASETELIDAATDGQILGCSTGLHELDIRTSGLCAPDMIVIAARPGAGKSALAFSMMCELASKNIPVGLITLEMSRNQVFNRMMAISSTIFASKIRNRELDTNDKIQYRKWAEIMKKWPVHINESANTLSKLRVKATIWKHKYGIKALFIDYLQLMSGDGKKGASRENEISDISRGLKQLAKTLEIPVIALSQLSREVEKRPSKMPQLSDLRESGSIEQDADFVLFMMRPEYYKMDGTFNIGGKEISSENLCIADLAKNRHGATGEFALHFEGPTMKFSNHASTYVPTVSGFSAKSIESRVSNFENELDF